MKKYWGIITVLLAVGLAVFFYFRFYFVFGEGVKSGELNYVVYKGLVFKTYEGKLIQTGIRSKAAGSIQSYEFEFSVEDEALARELMLQGGKTLELHYRGISVRCPGGGSRNSSLTASSPHVPHRPIRSAYSLRRGAPVLPGYTPGCVPGSRLAAPHRAVMAARGAFPLRASSRTPAVRRSGRRPFRRR